MNSESSLTGDKSDMDASQLRRENLDLKHRLEEEEAIYRRKLDTYRLAQQHQATLVSRLQTKVRHKLTFPFSTSHSLVVNVVFVYFQVLQYKKRCSDLENEMKANFPLLEPIKSYKLITGASGSALDAAQQHLREAQEEPVVDFESAMRRLTEEQTR
jgi:rootletin